MNVYAFLALLAFFSYLAIGFVVLLLDTRRSLNRIFFIYSLAAAAYSFAEFGYLQAESFETAAIWIKARAVWPFTFAIALHFHLILTRKFSWIRNPFKLSLIYFPAVLIFGVDILTTWITGNPVKNYGIWGYQPPEDSILPLLSGLYALGYTFIMLGLVLIFYLKNRQQASFTNAQAAYILGADILIIFVVLINTFLQQIPNFEYINVDSALLLTSNLVIAYAIWRFSLLRVTSRRAYGQILSNLSEFLFLVNPDGRISTANEQALKIIGYSEEELEDKEITDLFVKEKNIGTLYWFGTDKQNQRDQEGSLINKSGKEIHVSYTTIRIPVNEGKDLGWAYMGNIQSSKNHNNISREISRNFRSKNKNPVNQLINVINHDLSESARLIHLGSQMVKSDILQQKLEEELLFFAEEKTQKVIHENLSRNQKHLEYVKEEAMLLRKKLHALSDYAVADAEQQRSQVDLTKIVHTALSQCISNQKNQDLRVSIGDLPIIEAVPEQILRLLKHLISNSLKFRKHNQSLQIEVNTIYQDLKSCVIEIRDNGIGILPDYHQNIFGIFQRLHSRTEYEGVGIGLAICKKIVDAHHGDIWIESNQDQGTAVCISLPV